VLILALPRGGVETGFIMAKELELPLDILAVRKIGFPGYPEFAVGALSPDGQILLEHKTIRHHNIAKNLIDRAIENETKEAQRRQNLYRGNRPPLNFKNKIVIIVDDGVATGATLRAAITSVERQGAKKIVVAVLFIRQSTLLKILQEVDEVIYLFIPTQYFLGVIQFYEQFNEVSDQEVINFLKNNLLKNNIIKI
jgi:putative phosphoribosyl transferase